MAIKTIKRPEGLLSKNVAQATTIKRPEGLLSKNVAKATTIGIDIRDAHENGAGKARYALEITRALLKIAPENIHFHLFSKEPNPNFPSQLHNVQHKKARLDSDSILHEVQSTKARRVSDTSSQILIRGRGLFWHLNLKRYLKSRPVDLFLSPTSFIYPALAPRSQKTAFVVHDLISFLYSKTHAWFPTMVERFMLPRALKKCRFVICVSLHTAKDLAVLHGTARSAVYKEPSRKRHLVQLKKSRRDSDSKPVIIAPPAVSACIRLTNSEKLDLPRHFLLGVGTLSPRKNFQTLFLAFAHLAPKHKNLHIVIAGAKGWKTGKILRAVPAAFRSRIHFLGYVSESQLAELYSRAEMLVFPSVYEGFGMPILEAMACHCPVVASNRTSIPEVVGNAAYLFDPSNAAAFADAIEFMLGPKAQEIYRKRGFKRAQEFSWEESARRILAQLD